MGAALGIWSTLVQDLSQSLFVVDPWSSPAGCGNVGGQPSRAPLAELGGDCGGQGRETFVDGLRCENQSFPTVVRNEVPM